MEAVDVAIIGGGITGVGIAQRVQAAGYRVLLLEQGEIGAQTSANSSKLIHGGLRYLETGQLNLVRQSLAERKALLRLAPKLVKPIPFYIPIYQDSQRGALTIRAGLSLYAMLSELDTLSYFNVLEPKAWPSLGIKLNGLQSVFRYWDAQTDDHKLTVAVANSAELLGAEIKTQTRLQQIYHQDTGCVLQFQPDDGETQLLFAKCLINATGPWVNQTLELVMPKVEPLEIELVQGSHVVLDIPAPQGILYLESIFDKRVVFVMPWKGKTMIGTTETLIASPENAKVTEQEIDYLLGIYAHYFPHLTVADLANKVIANYCGIRVLPKLRVQSKTSGGAAFNLPREIIMRSVATHPHMLSIYGGKLTTFRHTAQEALQWISQRLGVRPIKANVDQLILE